VPRPLLILFVVMLFGGNAGAQVRIGLGPAGSSTSLQTVPFVTARGIERHRKGFGYYGTRRGEVSAGDCTVEMDARKKRQIVALMEHVLEEILDRHAAPDARVTVYVHGYNLSLEEACRQAALLQKRVGLEQRLLLFSWPAEAKLAGYLGDMGDVEWSTLALRDLLLALVDRFGSPNVDVIGHSLGARAVADAVTSLGQVRGKGSLGRVILIAADLDADVFIRDYASFSTSPLAIAVYVSPQDRALKAARNVRDQPRLGEGRVDLSSVPGLDVVEVAQWSWMFWGTRHLYHLDNDAVVADLREMLSGPPHRSGSRTIE
jgi:esterase/lipase superfamily enzyme